MTRHRLPAVAVLMAALLLAVMAPAPIAAAATVDTVVQWNGYATTALISQQTAPLNAPPVATLLLAMVHGAVYDAVNAIDGGYRPYLVSPPAMSSYSEDAAAATAAYRVLKDPSLKVTAEQLTVLDGHYATWLASTPDSAARAGGIGVGEAAAAAMLAARTNDGRFGSFRFTPGFGAGQWRPEWPSFVSDPNAWVARVKPFLVNSRDQFRSSGPDALTSAEYAADFDEVKAIGSRTSRTRTADQTDAGLFWTDNATAMWSRIFRQLSAARGLTLVENARFFAMLYLTGADALITVWADKAYWSFWRPISAIRGAETDGNPATVADSAWEPLFPTPPYPDHSSGHSSLSGSYVHTLQDFFGTDKIAFSDVSNASHTQRNFARFSDAINEIISARVYVGIHFRHADIAGANIGKHVAHWRDKNYFQPTDKKNKDKQKGH
jgi:hypothetical protein